MKKVLISSLFAMAVGPFAASGQGLRDIDPSNIPKGLPVNPGTPPFSSSERALIDLNAQREAPFSHEKGKLSLIIPAADHRPQAVPGVIFQASPDCKLDADLAGMLRRMETRIEAEPTIPEKQRARLIRSIQAELLILQVERDNVKRQAEEKPD